MALAVDVTFCVAMEGFTKSTRHGDASCVDSLRLEGAVENDNGPLHE